MLKFSANLSMLFTEVEFPARFARAAATGFAAVECMFPYAWPLDQLTEALARHRLDLVLHNLPPGDWQAGERGIACLPGREGEFQDGVGRAIEYATALNCRRLNCLVGIVPPGSAVAAFRDTLVANLQFAAAALERAGIQLLVEPLNDRDVPGFFLTGTREALALIAAVDNPNLALQYDVYHMQRMEGDLITTLTDRIARIGHIQIADNPGRHEPGTGEINFRNLFAAIDGAGYDGWIGCEYRPRGDTEAGLGWLAAWHPFPGVDL
jgi:hydroxypyruvate isomerase